MPGYLTNQELLALWYSLSDSRYADTFIRSGEGEGLAAITQMTEQLSRVSQAIDTTQQSTYAKPFSGQTDEPASSPRYAAVEITISRETKLDQLITFAPNLFTVEEQNTQSSPEGGELFDTGRKYVLTHFAALLPGETSIKALFRAERPGRGYNVPPPKSITNIVQAGAGYRNTNASTGVFSGANLIRVTQYPSVVVPAHVGQMIGFITGNNAGRSLRAVNYEPPFGAPDPTGGGLKLANTGLFHLSLLSGDFIPGELVTQSPSGATGIVIAARGSYIVIDEIIPGFAVAQAIVGIFSQAQAIPDVIEQAPLLVTSTGNTEWSVLDYEVDLGLKVTNDASPVGGRAGVLEAIGRDRKMYRLPGETENAYRERISTPADTVSPNALRRAANRVLAPYGLSGCLREVGSKLFPGLYLDGDPSSNDPSVAFALDMDFTVRPEDRYKVLLDYTNFRGFFLMCVPSMAQGEFGAACDQGPGGGSFLDASPTALGFCDGYPITAATLLQDVYRNLLETKAAGVGFEISQDNFDGCV